jgi:glycosyltransferase involved in cell wall biosynthesis
MDKDSAQPGGNENRLPVTIVMATFNGAQYISQQIESIRNQSHQNWKLIVRDDGSSDSSLQTIRSCIAADPRIELLASQDHCGCSGSFGVLLQVALDAGADYVLLSDQDDVWNADKIAVELREMREAEKRSGPETPLLVHSDLTVVDAELGLTHESFMAHCRLRHISSNSLQSLLAENFVTGCTVLVNRSLLEIAVPLPDDIVIHDWWLAQCAAATGEILFVPRPTVLYRQHAHNVLGIRNARKGIWHYLRHPQELSRIVARGVVQARRLLRRLEDRHCVSAKTELVRSFCRAFADSSSRLARLMLLLRIGIKRQRLIHYLGWLGAAMLLSRMPSDDHK